MSYQLKIIPTPGYLHAVVTGLNTRESVLGYMKDLLRECIDRKCHRLLVEERLEGPRLKTLDVFEVISQESQRALGHFDAIAYVDLNAEGDSMRFGETVATNRFVPVKVFSSIKDAEEWLRGKDRQPA